MYSKSFSSPFSFFFLLNLLSLLLSISLKRLLCSISNHTHTHKHILSKLFSRIYSPTHKISESCATPRIYLPRDSRIFPTVARITVLWLVRFLPPFCDKRDFLGLVWLVQILDVAWFSGAVLDWFYLWFMHI